MSYVLCLTECMHHLLKEKFEDASLGLLTSSWYRIILTCCISITTSLQGSFKNKKRMWKNSSLRKSVGPATLTIKTTLFIHRGTWLHLQQNCLHVFYISQSLNKEPFLYTALFSLYCKDQLRFSSLLSLCGKSFASQFFDSEKNWSSSLTCSMIFFNNIFWGDFFTFFILYSALLNLPPLRFHCADRCNWCIGSQTL
jgi:hypothetical protein